MPDYNARKASTLPVVETVDEADTILIVADGAPPDLKQATIGALAALAGGYAPQGATGAQGPQGEQGEPGTDLAVKGAVPTQADLALVSGVVDGDTYVTADTGQLWVYDSGPPAAWTAIATAIGPAGPAGATGPMGPTGATGATGPQGPAGVGIAGANVPVGTVLDFAGTAAPAGFLLCDGSEHFQSDYPQLAAILVGSNWPQAVTVGKFRTPPLNGKVTVGIDPLDAVLGVVGKLGGTKDSVAIAHNHPAGALNMASHQHGVNIWSGYQDADHYHTGVTAKDGMHEHRMSMDDRYKWVIQDTQFPGTGRAVNTADFSGVNAENVPQISATHSAHQHAFNTGGMSASHRHAVNGNTDAGGGAVTGTTGSAGVEGTNRNLQPYAVLTKIIRATV